MQFRNLKKRAIRKYGLRHLGMLDPKDEVYVGIAYRVLLFKHDCNPKAPAPYYERRIYALKSGTLYRLKEVDGFLRRDRSYHQGVTVAQALAARQLDPDAIVVSQKFPLFDHKHGSKLVGTSRVVSIYRCHTETFDWHKLLEYPYIY